MVNGGGYDKTKKSSHRPAQTIYSWRQPRLLSDRPFCARQQGEQAPSRTWIDSEEAKASIDVIHRRNRRRSSSDGNQKKVHMPCLVPSGEQR